VHVYFPDPWWKKRHRKRRVFGEPLVCDIERGLAPGGDLWVATDVEEYFGVICELMERHPRFRDVPIESPRDPAHEHDYLTNFERKYRIEGRPIYRKHYGFD
jgi:tRNA (guanine-N7-)-methyltransferase